LIHVEITEDRLKRCGGSEIGCQIDREIERLTRAIIKKENVGARIVHDRSAELHCEFPNVGNAAPEGFVLQQIHPVCGDRLRRAISELDKTTISAPLNNPGINGCHCDVDPVGVGGAVHGYRFEQVVVRSTGGDCDLRPRCRCVGKGQQAEHRKGEK
jgi:hypothetical protein